MLCYKYENFINLCSLLMEIILVNFLFFKMLIFLFKNYIFIFNIGVSFSKCFIKFEKGMYF